MTADDEIRVEDLDHMQRSDALAAHLLHLYQTALLTEAKRIDVGPGVQLAAIEMHPDQLIAFVIETISETWFYHPELLAPYAGEVIASKLAATTLSREDYDKIARPSAFVMAATLAGTLDMDNLPEDLGRMGLGPHAVDA